uniref:Uncharacterized protein n=1 Tax=Sphaerodactylus townsendi TaxID=933632 RepID=A0ACB8F275_9SAUR
MPRRAHGAVFQHPPQQRDRASSAVRTEETSRPLQHHGQLQSWPPKDGSAPRTAPGPAPKPSLLPLLQPLQPFLDPPFSLFLPPRDPARLWPPCPGTLRHPSSWPPPRLLFRAHPECAKSTPQERSCLQGLVLRPHLPLAPPHWAKGGPQAAWLPSGDQPAWPDWARQWRCCQPGGDQARWPQKPPPQKQAPALVRRNFACHSTSSQPCVWKPPPLIPRKEM